MNIKLLLYLFHLLLSQRVQGLPEEDAIQLIRLHGERLRLTAVHHAPPQDLLPLYQVTGGNPYALSTALGYMKHAGLSLESLVNALHQASHQVEGIFNYIFAHIWQLLSQEARQLLMAMTFFIESASKTAVSASAGVDGYYRDQAIQQLVELSLFNSNGALKEDELRYSVHPLTLAFARRKLAEHDEWEQEARERWFTYMDIFADVYGGKDWEDYKKYDVARTEIKNLLYLCDWASNSKRIEFYERGYKIFQQIEDLVFLSGLRDEDMIITRTALHIARKKNDSQKLAMLLHRRGWILLWLGQYSEAEQLLKESIWHSKLINDKYQLQVGLHNLGVLYWRQNCNHKSLELSKQASDLAIELNDVRQIISGLYYRGCAYYDLGKVELAESLFLEMSNKSQQIKWPRADAYACNRLADIYLMKGEANQARKLLNDNFVIAENFKDSRREGFFHRSYAMLEEAEGNLALAYDSACQALDLFTRLGMKQEIAEMKIMVKRLVASK